MAIQNNFVSLVNTFDDDEIMLTDQQTTFILFFLGNYSLLQKYYFAVFQGSQFYYM